MMYGIGEALERVGFVCRDSKKVSKQKDSLVALILKTVT